MPAQRASWRAGLAAWRERLAVSLPVLVMATLAVLTWWLVRHTPKPDAETPAQAKRHEVDYDMDGFVSWRFVADGSLATTVEGTRMRHFADDGSVEIDAMRLWAVDEGGRVFRATARLAWGDAELRHVRLRGEARVVREAQAGVQPTGGGDSRLREGWLEVLGEEIFIDTPTQGVRSTLPVTLVSEAGRVQAGNLDHDGRAGITRFAGRVKGSYWAPGVVPPPPAAASLPTWDRP